MKGAKKTNVERILETAGIPFTAHTFDGREGKADAVEIAGQLGVPPAQVFKTLVTTTEDRQCFVFAIPANATLDLKKAAKAAGVKSLAMLPLAKLFMTTGYRHGGCSPIGMKKAFRTFLDASAEDWETILISAGQIGMNVQVAPKPFAAAIPATFAPLTHETQGDRK